MDSAQLLVGIGDLSHANISVLDSIIRRSVGLIKIIIEGSWIIKSKRGGNSKREEEEANYEKI